MEINKFELTINDVNKHKRGKFLIASYSGGTCFKELYRRNEQSYAVYHDQVHVLETHNLTTAIAKYNVIGGIHVAYRLLDKTSYQYYSIVITDDEGVHDAIRFRLVDGEVWEQRGIPIGWSTVEDKELLVELDKIKKVQEKL